MISFRLQHRAALLAPNRVAVQSRNFAATRRLMVRGPPRIDVRCYSQGFTSAYDPDERGRGPIFERLVPRAAGFYPKDLKKLLDDYVVGQDRAKKTICAIVFNHAQKISYRKHLAEQIRDRDEKEARQTAARERRLAAELHGESDFISEVLHRRSTNLSCSGCTPRRVSVNPPGQPHLQPATTQVGPGSSGKGRPSGSRGSKDRQVEHAAAGPDWVG